MKEADIRKRHRYIGVWLAILILFQAGSGVVLSVVDLFEPHDHALHATENGHHNGGHLSTGGQDAHSGDHHADIRDHKPLPQAAAAEIPRWIRVLGAIHGGAGIVGSIYRVMLGIGVMSMALSGTIIFFKIQAKLKAAKMKGS